MEKIAVLIPCYNEAVTIGDVIADYRKTLPGADIYVYDNNSTDNTVAVARSGGQLCAVRGAKERGMSYGQCSGKLMQIVI